MTDSVFNDIHTKVVVLADNDGSGTANMVSGSLFISGSKLYIIGNAGAEVVTST